MQDANGDERPPTPPAPFSHWATNKQSFADALRSPLEVAAFNQCTRDTPRDTHAEAALASAAPPPETVKAEGLLSFMDAFAAGALPQAQEDSARGTSSFGPGAYMPSTQSARPIEPSITAMQELQPEAHSISMRTIPIKDVSSGEQGAKQAK